MSCIATHIAYPDYTHQVAHISQRVGMTTEVIIILLLANDTTTRRSSYRYLRESNPLKASIATDEMTLFARILCVCVSVSVCECECVCV